MKKTSPDGKKVSAFMGFTKKKKPIRYIEEHAKLL